jgi:hypothetical protein
LDIRSRLSPLVAYFSRIALGATTLLEQQVGAGVRPALDALSKITEELGRSKQAIKAYDRIAGCQHTPERSCKAQGVTPPDQCEWSKGHASAPL